ncbi:uncharacterized protein CTRU02_213358 [Colletotrichum truncatum]|uniref:Uncharacterized protein n=1 Tax=Colletotrichum truncatum TaxID=5467 RepID=A0ACC3YKH0_COLTU
MANNCDRSVLINSIRQSLGYRMRRAEINPFAFDAEAVCGNNLVSSTNRRTPPFATVIQQVTVPQSPPTQRQHRRRQRPSPNEVQASDYYA